MDKEIPLHPFEDFPRGELFAGLTRRQFFQSLGVEAELFARRGEGASAMSISSLGCMADAELYELAPKILEGCQISLQDHQVCGLPQGSAQRVVLFPCDELASFTFNLINGQNSLIWIAQAVADYSHLPFERAFAYTRGLFLTLVKKRVCLPINNPELG